MLCFIFAALIVLLDQLFKRWIVLTLALNEETVLLKGVVNLMHVENSGAAFSILPEQRWLLAGIAFVAALVLIAILLRYNEGFWGTLGLAAVLGGTVGNLIDRVFHGYVVDMFRTTFIGFAIFNIADIFITLGGITFCIFFIISSIKSGKDEKEQPEIAIDDFSVDIDEQYAPLDYQEEQEDIDYDKLFYGDSASAGEPGYDHETPPVYYEYDPGPQDSYMPEANLSADYDPVTIDPIYFEPEPVQQDYYEPVQKDYYEPVQKPPEFHAPAQEYHAPAQEYHAPAQEPPPGASEPLEASSMLDALGALETELTDLLEDYDLDDILREYGFENDKD